MSPAVFLAVVVGLAGLAGMIHVLHRSRRRRAIRQLAEQWHMRYAERDLFHLARKIAAQFPIAGAGDFRVLDLIYGSKGERHRYLFTAQYTLGGLHRQRREERAATFCEAREHGTGSPASPLVLGEEGHTLVEQYRKLAGAFECPQP